MVEIISREDLKAKMDRGEGFFLIEALKEEHYRHAHLPGAINLPPSSTERAQELIPDKDAEIIVYCMNPPWTESEEAARELAAMGYTNIKDYEGGKQDWMRAGLPTEGERQRRSK